MKHIIFLISIFFSFLAFSSTEETILVTAPSYGNFQVQHYVPEDFNDSFHVQETSPGQLSPYIGPFTGNTVDQLINGIRVSNAYFRSGPNQYFGWIPTEFVDTVSITDGGNIGGTINRSVSVSGNYLSVNYDDAVEGQTTVLSLDSKTTGVKLLDTNYGNVKTSSGVIPNSSYNQQAGLVHTNALQGDTYLIWSRNTNLPRTDKFNGGLRITGPRSGSFREYELQEFIFLNHEFDLKDVKVNLAYQDFKEYTRNKSKQGPLTKMEQNSYTINLEYNLTDYIRLYSTNTFENLDFQESQESLWFKDTYDTIKYGASVSSKFNNIKYWMSLGYKKVIVSDVSTFNTPEFSILSSYGNWFISYDYTTRPPGYSDLLQNKSTGRGVVVPNPNLNQEKGKTLRVGYHSNYLYIDIFEKKLSDSFSQNTLDTDLFQLTNAGKTQVLGTTISYKDKNLFNLGVSLDSRIEYIWSEQENAAGIIEPMQKTPDFWSYFKLEYNNWYTTIKFQPKDRNQPFKDLDDVRIFEYNKGLKTFDLGYKNRFKDIEYSVALNNIFNNNGRVYGSSVDTKARSVSVYLRYNFK